MAPPRKNAINKEAVDKAKSASTKREDYKTYRKGAARKAKEIGGPVSDWEEWDDHHESERELDFPLTNLGPGNPEYGKAIRAMSSREDDKRKARKNLDRDPFKKGK